MAAAEFRAALDLGDGVGDDSLRAHACSAAALVAALLDDPGTATHLAAQGVRSAERMVGGAACVADGARPRGPGRRADRRSRCRRPVRRLPQVLRDRGLTDWADEAFDVAALVLADRDAAAAAVALAASRPVGAADGRLAAMRDRLVRCRAEIEVGPAVPLDAAIARVLAAL